MTRERAPFFRSAGWLLAGLAPLGLAVVGHFLAGSLAFAEEICWVTLPPMEFADPITRTVMIRWRFLDDHWQIAGFYLAFLPAVVWIGGKQSLLIRSMLLGTLALPALIYGAACIYAVNHAQRGPIF